MVQVPVLAAEVGADDLGPEAFSQPVHRTVYEAVAAGGGVGAVNDLVDRATAAGLSRPEAVARATTHWVERIRAEAPLAQVAAAVTELAVAPLPVQASRADRDQDEAVRRYAAGVCGALAATEVNRRLAALRARQRRMSPTEDGYRELFEEIVGLENRRQQILRR